MASNGVWADNVLKVLRGKSLELHKQVEAIDASIKLVEAGFEMEEMILPSMFQQPKDIPKLPDIADTSSDI